MVLKAKPLCSFYWIVLLIGVLWTPMNGQQETDSEFEYADYSWKLQTPQGDTLSLERFKDKVLFINMWATWCAPCVAEMRSIAALRDSLVDTDIEFLLVSPEEPHLVKLFVRRLDYELPFYVEYERLPDAFDIEALPTTYIVDRSGKILIKHRGATNWNTGVARSVLRSLSGGAD